MGYGCEPRNGPTLATCVQPVNAPLRRSGGLAGSDRALDVSQQRWQKIACAFAADANTRQGTHYLDYNAEKGGIERLRCVTPCGRGRL